jgi:hypothetical protein
LKTQNTLVELKHSSQYKPILKRKNNLNLDSKHIYIKNYVYFYLFLNYFKKSLNFLDYSFIFLKKKKYLKNVLRSPNRHKKAQTKLIFKSYINYLKISMNISFDNKIKNSFQYFYLLSFFFFSFFKFFESSLLTLQKKKITFFFKYEL